ncbi:MAG: TonB-dependent receptor [Novosphingobium sp. 17-62-19]|uniref:TonB-dependent receptor domain-containing protein n=1 Tax=Novosphingobium sp. 17-62-19 TaxID=1970406 RepID=UPI000BDCAFCF|nr:TonB-dependent receptor [Novosphingobium sp. 17-62-19]OZA17223.1 MAG: TonB-dependent receptor [Novosphingobium sp. 17-62-19]HQS96487.1 TonB-dependent receptor [Novosphingobium sp.]
MRKFTLLVATLLATTTHQVAWAADEAVVPADGARENAAPAAPAKKAFSTGVAKGRDLLDTAISASVIDETDLAKLSVSSVAGIIQNIPGIRAETSDIDGFSAITVRGLPLSGDGSKFLQLQEDGLPVLEFGDLHFASADQFLRADLTLSQVQAIRGGSASTFASNSPGGVINFISRTGETAGGVMQVSSGVGHDLKRIDFAYGSPLGDGWRFHVGGFYRQGEGPRDIGYDGFKGGQVKANVTRQFSNGHIRVYAKYLDDRQPNYSLYPIGLSGTNEAPKISDLPGNAIRRNAYESRFTQSYLGVDQNNNPTTFDVANGLRGITKSIGLEAQFDIAGWTVSNRFRFADISGEYNESIPMVSAPAPAIAFLLGGPGSTLAYADGPSAGQAINDARLLALSIRINVQQNQMDNATNDLRASRVWQVGEGKLTTTAGVYNSSQSVDMYWNFANSINDLAGGDRNAPVNLTSAGGVPLTDGGTYAYGFGFAVPVAEYHNRYDLKYKVLAPYGSANYQIGKLAVGASVRWDRGSVAGRVFSPSYGGGRIGQIAADINGNGAISVAETKVAILPLTQPAVVDYDYNYVSYSAGVNYRLAEPLSVFGRYSRGARANAERILGSGSLNPNTGALLDPSTAFNVVKQAEVGVKFRKDGLTAYVTGFWASTGERNYQIGADASGQVIVIPIDRTYSAKGVEFEGEVREGPFSLTLGATWTKATIDKDRTDPALEGNRPRHIPTFSFQARPQVELGKVTFGTVLNGTTSSFAQDSNILKQPGYVLVSPFVQVRPADRVTFSVNAFNVFDKLAIVQLASAAIPVGGLTNAQVMNGRTVTASLRYSF